MGKGDKKSKRGKISNGSFGVRRPKKKSTTNAAKAVIRKKVAKPKPPSQEKATAKPKATPKAKAEPKIKAEKPAAKATKEKAEKTVEA